MGISTGLFTVALWGASEPATRGVKIHSSPLTPAHRELHRTGADATRGFWRIKTANTVPDRGPEFHTRLTDGSIAAQRPDGAEIVAAMQRARVAPDGMVRWTETCDCPTPLQHERATVLDRYFTGIETKVIDKPVTFDGAPLMDRLAAR